MFLPVAVPKQGSQPTVLLICRAELVTSSGKRELSWQVHLILAPSQQVVPTTELIFWPHLGREANLQPHTTVSIASSPAMNPFQRTTALLGQGAKPAALPNF